MKKPEVAVKQVEPLRVLSTRRRLAGQAEILAAIAELRPSVVDVLAGPAMALRLGFPKDGKIDVEIAFPVARAVAREGFSLKVLPALPMFAFTHVGPVVGGPEGTNLIDTRREFAEFVGERDVLVGDDPERFIYHEGAETHGDRSGAVCHGSAVPIPHADLARGARCRHAAFRRARSGAAGDGGKRRPGGGS